MTLRLARRACEFVVGTGFIIAADAPFRAGFFLAGIACILVAIRYFSDALEMRT